MRCKAMEARRWKRKNVIINSVKERKKEKWKGREKEKYI